MVDCSSGFYCCLRGLWGLSCVGCCCWIRDILPELDAAIDGVTVRSEDDMAGKILHEFGIAAAEKNGVADQRRPEAFDDVEN